MIDSRTFFNFADAPLYIGYHGENLVTGVNIDLAGVLPDGWGAALLLRRSGESTVYPAASTLDGKILRVVYSVADSAIEGRGEATIQLMGGNGEIMKSQTALTIVTHALNIGEPPDPVAHWLYEMEHRLIPPGGTDGQVLTKTGDANYAAEWEDPLGGDKPYLSLERVARYLYNVSFADVPNPGTEADFVPAGCSAYVQDGKLFRNLDWSYDHEATFHVKLPGMEGLAFMAGLTDTELDDELIQQLPYRMVDGVNENGIMVSTHVLYNDWTWSGGGNTPLTKLPYLVLTNVKSMDTIETDLSEILSDLRTTPALDAMEYLIQVLVTDGETSCVLAPATDGSNVYEIIDISNNAKLTNFRWVSDATVDRADLQTRPTGVERWNMMPCPLEELRFTVAYEEPTRLSEFIGLRGTTKDSTDEELTEIYNTAHALYLERERDGQTWQTMHSAVYSPKGLEHLWIQEDWEKDYIASSVDLSDYYTKEEADAKYVEETEKGSAGGIATLGADGKVPSSQLPEVEDEVVYLIHNESTYADALAAYNAGKTLKVRASLYDGAVIHDVPMDVFDGSFLFSQTVGLAVVSTVLSSSGWSAFSISPISAADISYDPDALYPEGMIGEAMQNVEAVIPPTASYSNKLATAADVQSVADDLSDVQAVIPSDASSANKLATENQIPTFTQAQMNAINSGITADIVEAIPLLNRAVGFIEAGDTTVTINTPNAINILEVIVVELNSGETVIADVKILSSPTKGIQISIANAYIEDLAVTVMYTV